jgi:hypothetical protein
MGHNFVQTAIFAPFTRIKGEVESK